MRIATALKGLAMTGVFMSFRGSAATVGIRFFRGYDTFSPARKYPKSRRGPSVWPRAFALPVADKAKAQRVQRSAGDAAALPARTSAGHRKRILGLPRRPKGNANPFFYRFGFSSLSPLESPLVIRFLGITDCHGPKGPRNDRVFYGGTDCHGASRLAKTGFFMGERIATALRASQRQGF